MCLRNKPISLTRGALWVRAWERCFCLHLLLPLAHSGGSIHINNFHLEKLGLHEFALFPDWGKLFRTSDTRWTRDVQLHPMSVAQPKGMHFMRHSHCVRFKKSVCLSPSRVQHLLLYVLCLFSFSRASSSSRRVPGGGMALLQYVARITFWSSAQNTSACQKKQLSQISVQFVHKIVTFINFLQRFDVLSKLFCPWSGLNCRLPFARHARKFVRPCLPESRRQHLLVRQIVFLNSFHHSFGPAKTANSEFHLWTRPDGSDDQLTTSRITKHSAHMTRLLV